MSPFPANLHEDTRCGEPQSLFTSHGVYSETKRQRGYLYNLSKRNGWLAPSQTCCHHQVQSLVKILRHRIIESA